MVIVPNLHLLIAQTEPQVVHNYIAIPLNFNLQFGVAKFNDSILPTSARRLSQAAVQTAAQICIRVYTFSAASCATTDT
jgi:hypothetical protein